MAARKIDLDTFRNYVKQGLEAKEIKNKFKLSSLSPLKAALLRLIHEDKQYYDVKGLFGRASGPVKVGKGGLSISLKRSDVKLEVGDFYDIKQEGDTITLTKK